MSPATTSAVAARMEGLAGAEHVRTEAAALEEYTIDGVTPQLAVQPENAAQAAEIVRIAAEEKLGVIPCGARTAVGLGMPPSSYDVALDMTRVTGIEHYDPGDLTISVNAGMPLAELARVLAKKNQFLPLAVPFSEKATVGGVIAAGLDSPLRQGYGTSRDFLIGAEFVDGTGAQAKSGGRVVKNVTGYDFHKLLCGSLGTLAVITRLNFRTYPLPVARRGFLASFRDDAGALRFTKVIGDSALTPTVLEMLSPECARLLFRDGARAGMPSTAADEWMVCVGFEGNEGVCERYAGELSRLAREAAAENAVPQHREQFTALLEILREAPATMRDAAANAVVMRLAALPSRMGDLLRALRSFAGSSWMDAPMLLRTRTVLYMALVPRERDESAFEHTKYFWKGVGALRKQLEFRGQLLFCPPSYKTALNVWAHAGTDPEMERKVKNAFDPNGLFARGRFAGGI